MTWHGCVTAKIIYRNAHKYRDVLTWPRATFAHVYLYKRHLTQPVHLLRQPQQNGACLQFPRLLSFSFSVPTPALPTLGSAISKTKVERPQKRQESLLILCSLPCEDTEKTQPSVKQELGSHQPSGVGTLILDLPASRAVSNKPVLNHPVYSDAS